jgi:cysteine desulfurase/selenocysteine lyase
MTDIRSDFPIFESHPDLVYLDSASTAQKPAAVIDAVAEYLERGYANIHRGSYELSELSESLYKESKIAVARLIGAESHYEIAYSNNATGAFNLLAGSMARSGWLKTGDRVLLSIVEHHANVVPWMMLRESLGIEVEFVGLNADYELDMADFVAKLTPNTKVVSFT